MGSASGGGGGRGKKGRKRGPGKSELRKFKVVKLGEGMYMHAGLYLVELRISNCEDTVLAMDDRHLLQCVCTRLNHC